MLVSHAHTERKFSPSGMSAPSALDNGTASTLGVDAATSNLNAVSTFSLSPLDSLSTVTLLPKSCATRRSSTGSSSSSTLSVRVSESVPTGAGHKTSTTSDERRHPTPVVCRLPRIDRIDPTDQRLGSPLAAVLSESAVNLDRRLSWLRRAQTARYDSPVVSEQSSGGDSESTSRRQRWSISESFGAGENEEEVSLPVTPSAGSAPSEISTLLDGVEASTFVFPDEQQPESPPARAGMTNRRHYNSSPEAHLQSPASGKADKAESGGSGPGMSRRRSSPTQIASNTRSQTSLAHPMARTLSRASSDLSSEHIATASSSKCHGSVALPCVDTRPLSSRGSAKRVTEIAHAREMKTFTPPINPKMARQSRSGSFSGGTTLHTQYSLPSSTTTSRPRADKPTSPLHSLPSPPAAASSGMRKSSTSGLPAPVPRTRFDRKSM